LALKVLNFSEKYLFTWLSLNIRAARLDIENNAGSQPGSKYIQPNDPENMMKENTNKIESCSCLTVY